TLASTEPRSFERGVTAGKAAHGSARSASTEPRSFERGVAAFDVVDGVEEALQRSRVLSNAESNPSRSMQTTEFRFNGAAFFRTRSRALALRMADRNSGFNGAAFFRTRSLA